VDSLEPTAEPELADNMQGFGFTKVPVRFLSARNSRDGLPAVSAREI
jgi:hypothetical protein